MQNIKTLPSTRTILVTNFSNLKELTEFKNLLPKEDIFEIYSIPRILNLFVTFYDFRKAVLFYQTFRTTKLFTNLNFSYTISKNEIQKGNEEVLDSCNQSSMIIYFKDTSSEVTDQEAMQLVSKYGEVRDIRLSKPYQKIVEFYDFRAAKKAYSSLNTRKYKDGHLLVYYVWDTMMNYKNEIIRRTDEVLKGLPVSKELLRNTNSNNTNNSINSNNANNNTNNNTNNNNNYNNTNNNNNYNNTVEQIKRIKVENINNTNITTNNIIDVLDMFIYKNINEIENMFKH